MKGDIKKYQDKLAELKQFTSQHFPNCDIDVLFDPRIFNLSNLELDDPTESYVEIPLAQLLSLDCIKEKVATRRNSYSLWEMTVNSTAQFISLHREGIKNTRLSPEVHRIANEGKQKVDAQYQEFFENNDPSSKKPLVRTLKNLTFAYLESHRPSKAAKSNNILRHKKYHIASNLFNILVQKNKPAITILNEFENHLQTIINDPDLQKHRDPSWKRYLKNVMGVLFFGVAPIYSKIKYNTFCFWQPESQRLIRCIQGEINDDKQRSLLLEKKANSRPSAP